MKIATHRWTRPASCFLTILALFAAAPKVQAQTAGPLPASTLQQINELLSEKENRSPAERKISSSLLYTAKAKRGLAITANVQALAVSVPLRKDGRVDVEIVGTMSKAVIEKIQNAGAEPLYAGLGGRVLRAAVPLDKLEALAGISEVTNIHPAMRAMTQSMVTNRGQLLRAQLLTALDRPPVLPSRVLFKPLLQQGAGLSPILSVGSVTSQGSRAHGADRARNWFGVNGAGVKVGVLSDSDDLKENSIATGDLPPDTVTLPGQDGRPGSGEGTAMMEIVHDMAPAAKLFFATAFTSPESFAENIRALRFTYGCDIIVDDVIYYFESPYADDIIAQAVADVIADGAMYLSSAGNSGNLNDGTSGTWEGDFKKAKAPLATLPSGYEVHDFGRGVISDRIELVGGPVILHWSDFGNLDNAHSANDYDLFILTPDLRSVAVASTDIQDGDDIPFEFLGFLVPAGYHVVVARKTGAADRAVRIQIFNGELALATDGATYGHNSVEEALGVAAVDAAQAGTGEFVGGATTTVELFSSDGPRRMFYDRNGHRLNGAPLFKNGGGETRQKPDITGADGVVTTLPPASGLNPFFGTSAAAPHVAGIAALVKSAKLTITPTKLRNSVIKAALDIESLGRDRDSGHGIASAFGALTFINASPKPFLQLQSVTPTVTTGDGDEFIEPGESVSLATVLANTGGATATHLSGLLTTSTPGVTITGAVSPWVDLAPGATGSNSLPFTFNLAPSAICGLQPAFTLTASFSATTSPTTFTFKVPTGTPSSTPTDVAFTGPRAVIPDENAAGVNIPIVVSGVGALSDITFSIDGTSCSSAIGSTTVGVDHTWVGDLVMTLTSPSGTRITLLKNAGGTGNSGNNFCQTVLSDAAATSIQNITVAQAPFTGTFKPFDPLSAFRGENANGTWILNVVDQAFLDTGGVRAVSLHLKGYSCGS